MERSITNRNTNEIRKKTSPISLLCKLLAEQVQLSCQFSQTPDEQVPRTSDGRSYTDLKRQSLQVLEMICHQSPEYETALRFINDAIDGSEISVRILSSPLQHLGDSWLEQVYHQINDHFSNIQPESNRYLLRGFAIKRALDNTPVPSKEDLGERRSELLRRVSEESKQLTTELKEAGIDPNSDIEEFIEKIVISVITCNSPLILQKLIEE
ncbi:hypothetical protein A2Z22_05010 [Candidatus Woesebacteria bacterium RBG_16_34_12]|uniref:Uncharacterized protein n=1 Tax=Candidatus Woesebacteria bacterium RBG_16_34_12 TaxID=1802480 RepID=A0A1F7X9V0_9BACT|nr:MAG: hypothetical protein A2Z22_05010 [Candidatus Woesebacteria bacterium RBG_16_34_12]